jgi:hypothetical protein
MPRQVQLALKGKEARELTEFLHVLVRRIHDPLQVVRVQHVPTASLIDQL